MVPLLVILLVFPTSGGAFQRAFGPLIQKCYKNDDSEYIDLQVREDGLLYPFFHLYFSSQAPVEQPFMMNYLKTL